MKKNYPFIFILVLITMLIISGCAKEEQEKKDKTSNEETTENEVSKQKTDDKKDVEVVTINDSILYEEDLEFYTLVEKIKIELSRSSDKKSLSKEDFEDKNLYWDEQLETLENINVQLNNLIEIYTMSLLAEEKHYFIPDEDLNESVDNFIKKVKKDNSANKLIDTYGEKKFKRNMNEYMRQSMLRDRVAEDLEKELKKEKPKATEPEINFELHKDFEELYMDQLKSLKIKIHEIHES